LGSEYENPRRGQGKGIELRGHGEIWMLHKEMGRFRSRERVPIRRTGIVQDPMWAVLIMRKLGRDELDGLRNVLSFCEENAHGPLVGLDVLRNYAVQLTWYQSMSHRMKIDWIELQEI
jgi:hypothetical protein